MFASSHIRSVLICVKYQNRHRNLDVYLLFAILLGQIKSKLNYTYIMLLDISYCHSFRLRVHLRIYIMFCRFGTLCNSFFHQLYIKDKYHFIGVSPDGLIRCKDRVRRGFGIVEIKCLKSFEDRKIVNPPCLDADGYLKESNEWYTQIQVCFPVYFCK